jgi:hypothetical protein
MSDTEQTYSGSPMMRWNPSSSEQTREVLNWLELLPHREVVGFISIHGKRPRIVSYRNRFMWESILRDICEGE